jgi:protein-S-isoprenylcysteine O-methyltransferase Ste14
LSIKILPVVQLLIAAGAMWAIALLIPFGYFEFSWMLHLSAVIVVIGMVLVLAGGAAFIKANTTVNPMSPEKSLTLVTSGIYAVSRNPMYLGGLVALLAWGFYLGSAPSFIMLPIFCGYITKTQISFEEQILEKKFGDRYRAYCSKVRRWI